jgi:hypothetical protein
MTAQIIPFGNRKERQRPAAPLTQETRAAFSSSRVKLIGEKMDRNPMMESIEERRRAANNMWRILAELDNQSPRIRKRDVLHEAGLGGEDDSTKRLPYYAIDPDLPEDKQLRRAESVTKKIKKYEHLAQCAARLSKKVSKDHFLLVLVEGTKYAVLPHEARLEPAEATAQAWAEIRGMIELASRSIAAKYELRECFDQIITAGIRWESWSPGELVHVPSEAYRSAQLEPRPALVGNSDLAPCPSVFLGNIQACSRVPCEVRLDLEIFKPNARLERLYKQLVDGGLNKLPFRAFAQPSLGVHLELRPHGREGEVAPVLQLTDAPTYFYAAEDFTALAHATSDPTFKAGNPIKLGDMVGIAFGKLEPLDMDTLLEKVTPFLEDDDGLHEIHAFPQVTFLNGLEEAYWSSLHGHIPEGGSLLVTFDDHAKIYLDKPIASPPGSRAFCEAVKGAPRKSRKESEHRSSEFFDDASMLADLERSISSMLGSASLVHLLDEQAKAFVIEAKAAIKQHGVLEEARRKRLEAGLERLRRDKEAIVREYGKSATSDDTRRPDQSRTTVRADDTRDR